MKVLRKRKECIGFQSTFEVLFYVFYDRSKVRVRPLRGLKVRKLRLDSA